MSRIPSPSRRLMSLLIAAPFVAVACTVAQPMRAPPTQPPRPPLPRPTAASRPRPTPPAAPSEPVAEAAAWLDIELTDAETGETFTLASLAGEVVAIEPMAIWCSNCKAQQDNVKQAYADIEAAGVRYISLGIDPGEDPEALARYAEQARLRVDVRAVAHRVLARPQRPLRRTDPVRALDAAHRARRRTARSSPRTFGFHGPEQLLAPPRGGRAA